MPFDRSSNLGFDPLAEATQFDTSQESRLVFCVFGCQE